MGMINSYVDKLTGNKYAQYICFALSFLLLLVATIYFYPLHLGHDLNFHLIRLDALAEAFKDGSFPVYIDHLSANGYGYATKWFYCDLMLIPFAWVAQCSNVLTAYKVMIISYTVLCGILSYVSIYKVFKNRYIAFVFALLYTFSYYRLYDVYNRAALGETICLTFIPLVIWGAYEIIKGNYKRWYILSIAFSLMIFSHVNTPVVVAVVTGFFFIVCYKSLLKEPVRLIYLGIAALATIITTAYYLFPLAEQMLSNEFYYGLTDERAVSFPVMAGEPFKYIIRGLFSGITYVVPEIAGIGVIITFTILLRAFIFKDETTSKSDLFLVIGLICLLIISPLYPWRVFPFSLIGFIQFSWRFYSITTLLLCVAGAVYYFKALQTDKRRFLVGIPILLILNILLISNSGQVFTNERPVFDQFSREGHHFGLMGAEYMPASIPNVNSFFQERANDSIRSVKNHTETSNLKRASRILLFDAKTASTDQLELPLVYYKGYQAEVNNKPTEVNQSKYGLVEIPITESGEVKVYFAGTTIQNISPYISLLAILLLTGYIIRFNRKDKKTDGK